MPCAYSGPAAVSGLARIELTIFCEWPLLRGRAEQCLLLLHPTGLMTWSKLQQLEKVILRSTSKTLRTFQAGNLARRATRLSSLHSPAAAKYGRKIAVHQSGALSLYVHQKRYEAARSR